ncbi:phage tail protein [Streptomyces sp. NPDC093223]|uniref:phage tail protein n=1 Tax=Streptomyces sp. NPDC093223 TaxID=3366033 RepID=UPI00380208F0
MRGAVPGLGSPYTLAQQLPAVFQEDRVTEVLTVAWDESLAPVISALDCLDAYLDPRIAPSDFVHWLADRLGVPEGSWPVERRRAMTMDAVRLHGRRGCADALRTWLGHMTGERVEVHDNGGVYTSAVPDGTFPAAGLGPVRIRVFASGGTPADPEAIGAMAAMFLPAHVPFRVEVVTG